MGAAFRVEQFRCDDKVVQILNSNSLPYRVKTCKKALLNIAFLSNMKIKLRPTAETIHLWQSFSEIFNSALKSGSLDTNK